MTVVEVFTSTLRYLETSILRYSLIRNDGLLSVSPRLRVTESGYFPLTAGNSYAHEKPPLWEWPQPPPPPLEALD